MNETRLIVSQRLDLFLSAHKDKPLVLFFCRGQVRLEEVWRGAVGHFSQTPTSCKM